MTPGGVWGRSWSPTAILILGSFPCGGSGWPGDDADPDEQQDDRDDVPHAPGDDAVGVDPGRQDDQLSCQIGHDCLPPEKDRRGLAACSRLSRASADNY